MNKKQLLKALEKVPPDAPIEFLFQDHILLRPDEIFAETNTDLPRSASVKKGVISLRVDCIVVEIER